VLFAGAIVFFIDHGGSARAVIAVGAAVTSANRLVNEVTKFGLLRAMANAGATARGHLAPQALCALFADEAAACRANPAGARDRRQRRRHEKHKQCDRQQRPKAQTKA
jgi:hypothetical protein